MTMAKKFAAIGRNEIAMGRDETAIVQIVGREFIEIVSRILSAFG
jgi:hypothetical protein